MIRARGYILFIYRSYTNRIQYRFFVSIFRNTQVPQKAKNLYPPIRVLSRSPFVFTMRTKTVLAWLFSHSCLPRIQNNITCVCVYVLRHARRRTRGCCCGEGVISRAKVGKDRTKQKFFFLFFPPPSPTRFGNFDLRKIKLNFQYEQSVNHLSTDVCNLDRKRVIFFFVFRMTSNAWKSYRRYG